MEYSSVTEEIQTQVRGHQARLTELTNFLPSLTATFKTTKPFRLPGLLMSDKSSIKSIGMSATSKLRKITYLPPPLPNAGRTETAQKRNGFHTPSRRSQDLQSRSRLSDAYPSPSRTMSSPLSRNISSPRRKMTDDDDVVYHPLSPPTSDLPIPEDDMNVRLNVNSRDIQQRYPGIRAFINEVRLLLSFTDGLQ
jgi:hypothetical protein